MANNLNELIAQSDETVAALLQDGANAMDKFTIEHHLVSTDFTKLEKAAVELVKAGYHVDDADEFETDDGARIFAFVAVSEVKLDADILRMQTQEITEVANITGVDYDGWGTYFGEDDEEE
ncbi:ribonuclease E inhibitor RraB [Pseudidiomarina donghaiensis]|uniref:Ribonuclease E inhibitor RraB n=1 Tax=Pseudidiomarina donghaiensis TaxID=519452 RepID=A0A432XEA7_9GAMM|nr:ribonuclease E inhibitor RraB [Pseudidiomarina donghaiensis]RUO47045.1 ribonuclease E inhibitor RraB [Pseudidiomarina donghaiensis]SFV23527.1 hypothetical protein SAMN04488139_1818 [Pseudidiomarina donghaiensis]